jgi:hypothetical protein
MIRTKSSSVNMSNLNPRLLQFAEDMSNMFDGLVITSANDAVHMKGSRHYINKALDFGANSSEPTAYANFKAYLKANDKALKEKYGLEDILDEFNHIHVEMPITDVEQKHVTSERVKLAIGISLVAISIGITIYIARLKTK